MPDPVVETETKIEAKVGTATPPVDASEGFRAALKKHDNDALSLARDAWVRADDFKRQLAEATGKIPAADAVVLTKDEAAELAAYRGLGKASEVTEKLTLAETLAAQVATNAREKLDAQAAAAHGFDPEVLATLRGDLKIEIVDGKDRLGKAVKVAEVVTTEGEGKTEKEVRTPLDKYAEKNWAKFLPSLTVKTTTSGPIRSSVPFPRTVAEPTNPAPATGFRRRAGI